jgi:hypothetical protein
METEAGVQVLIASSVRLLRIRKVCPFVGGSTTVTTWCVESGSRGVAHETGKLTRTCAS